MSGTQRATLVDLAKFRLERNGGLLATHELPPYWAGVLAGLRAAEGVRAGQVIDLAEWVKKTKVTS